MKTIIEFYRKKNNKLISKYLEYIEKEYNKPITELSKEQMQSEYSHFYDMCDYYFGFQNSINLIVNMWRDILQTI